MMMVKMLPALLLVAFFACVSFGHQEMQIPKPRTNSQVIGIGMGDFIRAGNGDPTQNNRRPLILKPNSAYYSRPCGGAGIAGGTIEMPSSYRNLSPAQKTAQFDVSRPAPTITTYTAGSEVELSFRGYFHPGLISVRLCYENCMSMASYQQYILGYWFMEGTGGNDNIFNAIIKAKVKIPNRNCDRCVMQFITDSSDARSYVNCADVKIVGAQAGRPANTYQCNGHPYCNCSLTAGSVYGLGRRCPVGISGSGSGSSHPIMRQISVSQFCRWCIKDGCPSTCGGRYKGSYNGANRLGGTHTSALPAYVTCTSSTCKCPGCIASTSSRDGSTRGDVPFPTTSPDATSFGPPTDQDWVFDNGNSTTNGTDVDDEDMFDDGNSISSSTGSSKPATGARPQTGELFVNVQDLVGDVAGETIAEVTDAETSAASSNALSVTTLLALAAIFSFLSL